MTEMNETMWSQNPIKQCNCRNRPGIVLLVTLVLLVIFSTLGYTLSSRLAAQRHREQYIIDYQAARYGCDSAARYTFAELQDINIPPLISRPNEPDFSDLFTLSEVEYKKLLAEWAAENINRGTDSSISMSDTSGAGDINDVNDVNNMGKIVNIGSAADSNNPNSLVVRGPYGPPWPLVIEPVEFKIGSATVRIEIEDENAKYPIGWALLDDKEVKREALAGLETFCEWMDVNEAQIDSLKQELKGISEIKTFKLDFKPIKKKTAIKTRKRTRHARRRRGGERATRFRTTTVSVSEQSARQTVDFAKLFHSSLINAEALARPTIVSESRKESALKYMGLWASRKININTAPRQVLEAAFTFGGDADEIAEEIIQRRRIEPFKDIEDLKKSLFRYSDSIEKCEKCITTVSRFFTIKITAVSGVAEASTVIAVTKDGKKLEKIAILSG